MYSSELQSAQEGLTENEKKIINLQNALAAKNVMIASATGFASFAVGVFYNISKNFELRSQYNQLLLRYDNLYDGFLQLRFHMPARYVEEKNLKRLRALFSERFDLTIKLLSLMLMGLSLKFESLALQIIPIIIYPSWHIIVASIARSAVAKLETEYSTLLDTETHNVKAVKEKLEKANGQSKEISTRLRTAEAERHQVKIELNDANLLNQKLNVENKKLQNISEQHSLLDHFPSLLPDYLAQKLTDFFNPRVSNQINSGTSPQLARGGI